LVINDIGPYVSSTGLRRIGQYISNMPGSFATIEDAEGYLRTVLAPYGYLIDEHWRHLTRHSVSWDDERKHFSLVCDPSVAKAFQYPWYYPLDLWEYWDAIKFPMLVLHGGKSDLLSRDLTLEMRKRNQRAEIFKFDDCGHAPPLMAMDQIDIVIKFLKIGDRGAGLGLSATGFTSSSAKSDA
jgi:pimeloyl-ACP methyl ester carboxylesterase